VSADGRGTGGTDTEADGARDSGPAPSDGQPGDRVVIPPDTDRIRFDTGLGGAGGAGGVGGTGGTGGVGGFGGTGGDLVDAYVESRDDAGGIDGPQAIDTSPEAGVLIPDAPLGSEVSGDTLPGPDTGRPDAVIPDLTVNAGADTTVCAGFTATLGTVAQGGVPPYTYAWSASPACTGCITNPSSAQTTVSPDATTTFTLNVTDSRGVSVSDIVLVTVPAPVADAASDATIDPGASAQIGTEARTGYTYAWTCDRPTCLLSSLSAARPTANPSLSTMYTVTATSPEGCIATDSTVVWVNLPVSTTPVEGGTYPRSGSLFVQFGAAIAPTSLSTATIILRESDSETAVNFDYVYDNATQTVTITPSGPNYNATIGDYTLTLVGGADGIRSNDPVRPQRLPENVVLHYTIEGTVDTTKPTIVSRSPISAAGNVPTNASVSAAWSEALNPTSVNATSFTVSTGGSAVAGTVTYDPATFTVTFVPKAAFLTMTTYTVRATAQIEDISGNVALAVNWNFTTGLAADTTPPTVTTVLPAAGATKVSVGSSVIVTFSEAVNPASAVGGVQVSTGATPVAGDVAYDATTRQAVFTPTDLLTKQTVYTVSVSGVQDIVGNTMGTPFTSTFTTANVLFSDTFEAGTSKWTLTSPWGLTTAVSASPTHSLTDSPAGDYGASTTSATSIDIDATGIASVTLSYWVSGSIALYDYLRVEYSTKEGPAVWTTAANLTGDLGNGVRTHTLNLGPAGTAQLKIRFRVIPSVYSFRDDGAYIDNVLVQAN
jgi:hypothetical protein